MKTVERKDLVVGVEYFLGNPLMGEKAHYVGRDDWNHTLFFISIGPTRFSEDSEGFILFSTVGDPFLPVGTI